MQRRCRCGQVGFSKVYVDCLNEPRELMGSQFWETLLFEARLVSIWSTDLVAEHSLELAPDGLTTTADPYVNEALSETHGALLSPIGLQRAAGSAALRRSRKIGWCSLIWVTAVLVWTWISVSHDGTSAAR